MKDPVPHDLPSPTHVSAAQLHDAKAAVCEIYEAAVDGMYHRPPVVAPMVALANAAADLRVARERLLLSSREGLADPVALRRELVGTGGYLLRTVVQLQLPAAAPSSVALPREPRTSSPGWSRSIVTYLAVAIAVANVMGLHGVTLNVRDGGSRAWLIAMLAWSGATNLVLAAAVRASGRADRGRE